MQKSIGENIWGIGTWIEGIDADGSVRLWLNGTLYKCQPGKRVLFRSGGTVCTPDIPIYYVTQCSLEGSSVILDYFTYNTDCRW